jgi:hypothetical protein
VELKTPPPGLTGTDFWNVTANEVIAANPDFVDLIPEARDKEFYKTWYAQERKLQVRICEYRNEMKAKSARAQRFLEHGKDDD